MANKINRGGDDSVAAHRLARSEPMSGRNSRSDATPRRTSSIERIAPGSDPSRQIDRLYSEGRRTFPRVEHKTQNRSAVNQDAMMSASPEDGVAGNFSSPQAAEDQRAPNYNNDASGWVRATSKGEPSCFNETAENKPGFDRSPPRSKMRR